MITIPTGELVGILDDVYHFASPIKDFPDVNCVQLRWDGEQLHALATDRSHCGWSTWDQDDETSGSGDDPDQYTTWGGMDEPWSLTISRLDAKKLIDAFKLGPKALFIPLTAEVTDGGALKVVRAQSENHSQITMVIADTEAEFPDLVAYREKLTTTKAVERLQLNRDRLAHFAKVRPRGETRFHFNGEGATVVTIGERFWGTVHPIRDHSDRAAKPTNVDPDGQQPFDLLRDGTGVHLGGELDG
jgi:hypothetical protein